MRILLESLVAALLLTIQMANAVKICCPRNHVMKDGECFEMTQSELSAMDPYLNVTFPNGAVIEAPYENQYGDSPMLCGITEMLYLDNLTERNRYTLFEDGIVLRHFDKTTMSRWKYCLQPHLLEDGSIRVVPHTCPEFPKKAQTVVIIISMVCLLLIITAYLLVKKLRNLFGKCFICYMACLFMGYLFLLLDLWDLSQDFCLTAGFLGYLFFMAAFCWLSVISLELQKKLSGSTSVHSFLNLSIYAWGMAVALTGVTYLANQLVHNNDLSPRIGTEDRCWINTQYSSAIIYFYGPMFLIIMLNLIMLIVSVTRRIDVSLNLENDLKRKQELLAENFLFFFRLFIILGISSIFKIISYYVQSNQFWADVFLVADYLNWSQGFIIFVLFILKGSTQKLLREGR
ncbi:G-protein coupled receptor Mth-like isoform X1 [Drosophila takahashii]|uniref:G-protein coupled receptor Mth-like isoform X1 n=2 Tax=Drosophila takahashii TaxID=29030 RepID=UPI003898E14D